MALIKKTQHSFAGGLIDKDLTGRQDLAKYAIGCLELKNFKVRKQGNIIKRPGTNRICDATNIITGNARLFPIVKDRSTGYYLLMTQQYVYLLSDAGVLMTNGTWSRSPAQAEAYKISHTFDVTELRDISYCQSGDTLFFAHRNHRPCKIMRNNLTLTFEEIDFNPSTNAPPEIASLTCIGTWNGEEYGGAETHVDYAISTVTDGVESTLSTTKTQEYFMPWPSNAAIEVEVDTDTVDPITYDSVRVYKRSGDLYGLIGTLTVNDRQKKDISESFTLSNTRNYPIDFPTFDQNLHLRDVERNPFAPTAMTINGGTTTYSSTAHQQRNSTTNQLTFNIPSEPKLRKVCIGVGSLMHCITYDASNNVYNATYSEFVPTKITTFKIKIQYNNAGTWQTSGYITNRSDISQTPGTGWTETSSGSGVYRKIYTDSPITGTTSEAVKNQMSAPDVPGIVYFDIPTNYANYAIKKITLYGFIGTSTATTNIFEITGITCFDREGQANIFTDEYVTPDLTVTPRKDEDHFLVSGDYPGTVQMYEQRLVYASSENSPFTFWMSCTGDLYNFNAHDYVRASDAITATIAATEMPRINHMIVHRDLMLFADGGEWLVSPSSGNAITPSTVSAKLQSAIGCASWIPPVRIGEEVIFCDRSGESLISTRYSFASDSYESNNLSVLSQRLFRNNPIQAMAYVQFPESTIECVLADGTIASLVYMKEHDVCAWSKTVLGGDLKATDIATNKTSANGSSSCYMIAYRMQNTTKQWRVLSMRDIDPDDDTILAQLRLDDLYTTNSQISGRTNIKVRTQPSYVYTYAHGYIYDAELKTVSPEFTEKETAQMEIKNATEAELRVIDSGNFSVRQATVDTSLATPVFTTLTTGTTEDGWHTRTYTDTDARVNLVGTNSQNGSLVITSTSELPLTILSISVSYRVEFRNHGATGNG